MPETASTIRVPLASSGARLKWRAKSALIGAFFGSVWMIWAAIFGPVARTPALIFVGVLAIPLVGWAVSRFRAVRRYEDFAADRERWASIAPLYWLNTAAEWVLTIGAVVVLAHLHRYALIPQFAGAIIGLHFLALARILGEPRYYIMGAVMILSVLASLLIPEGGVRNVIACAGTGLPMWVTAVVILFRDWNQSAVPLPNGHGSRAA
jgi:hypothetical protein